MAERSVRVRLEAQVGTYVANIEKAGKATDQLAQSQEKAGKAADTAARQQEQSSQRQEKSSQRTAAQLAREAKAAQDAAAAAGLKYDADGRLVESSGKVLTSSQAAAHGLEGFSDAVYLTERAAAQAAPQIEATESRLERLSRQARENELAFSGAGKALTAFGAGTVAALGFSAKAAMDWESAWAGVTKTVDGTPAQMAEMEEGLRGMARELPATHEELAAVAEAAGQLGVKRQDILGFTRTMVDLGVSTNLTADEAATAIAQISNVMGTMERDGAQGVARFGAALVALGNDGASTEADILNMAQRIAGAGATIGATESEVLALSNTLSSMGVRAELGGGVATRVLLKMFSAIKTGGKDLEAWAAVAGTSASEFAAAFESSPVKALDMVSQGLARVNESGGNVVSTMADLGLKGTEELQVMLALASSGTLLADSLDLGAQAWEDNAALVEEAGKRYETSESQIKMAWNSIKDAAISAGAVILPVVADLAQAVGTLAGWFSDLPGPVQGGVTALAGLAGAVGLGAGAFLMFLPRAIETRDALRSLGPMGTRAASGLGRVGRAAGIGAAAFIALEAASSLARIGLDELAGADDFAAGIRNLEGDAEAGAAALDKLATASGSGLTKVEGLGHALETVNLNGFMKGLDFVGSGFGLFDTEVGLAEETLRSYDAALADLANSGSAQAAADGFAHIRSLAEAQGMSVEELAELFPQYADALRDSAGATGAATSQTGALSGELDGVAISAEDAAEALEAMLDQMFNAGLLVRDVASANRDFEESLDTFNATIAENGQTLDRATEAGRANEAALHGIANAGEAYARSLATAGASNEELSAVMQVTYDNVVAGYNALGIFGEEAEAAAREVMGIPPGVSVQTWIDDNLQRGAEEAAAAVNGIPGEKAVNVHDGETITTLSQKLGELHTQIQMTPDKEIILTEPMSPQIRAGLEALGYIVETLPNGNIKVTETGTDATGKKIDDTARKERIAQINAVALTDAANTALNRLAEPRNSFINVMFRQLNDPPAPAGGSKPVGTGTVLRPPGMATGGAIVGPGTETSDEAGIYRLANGEHVLTAAEVRALGGQAAVYRFRAALRDGTDAPALATAQAVQYRDHAAPPPVVVSAAAGPTQFTGNLFLDSGEFLGAVRGVARQEADGVVARLDTTISDLQRRGVYTGGKRG